MQLLVFSVVLLCSNTPAHNKLVSFGQVCLSLTAKRLARKNCVVKNLEAVETLGQHIRLLLSGDSLL